MRRILLLIMPTILFLGLVPAAPAGADHPTLLSHYGHGHHPQVTADCSQLGGLLCRYTAEAERAWQNAGFNGWSVGHPWLGCRVNDGYVTVCVVPGSSIGGYAGQAWVEGIYNPKLHIDQVLIRICGDCGLNETQYRLVIQHEYGHAIGLGHSNDHHSVMHSPVYHFVGQHDSNAVRVRYNGHGEG
jgi:hypothetical protein